MRRLGVILCGLALAGTIAQAQTVVIGVKPASLAPVIVFPASAVNGAGVLGTTCLTFALGTTVCEPAANALEQRNGTNGQAFRSYNTYTDASNYERANLSWVSNAFNITVGALGTGLSRSLIIGTDTTSTGNLTFQTGGSNRWSVSGSTGALINSTTGNVLLSGAAPTISSGFGTSPTIASNNGTAAFTVNVGTGGTATTGVIGLPAATTGWNCWVADLTAQAAHTADRITRQTASTTTTASIENQIVSTGATAGAPWAASDILRVSCFAY